MARLRTLIIGDEIVETSDDLLSDVAAALGSHDGAPAASAREKLVSIRRGGVELALTRRELDALLHAIDRIDATTPGRRLDAGRLRDAVVRAGA